MFELHPRLHEDCTFVGRLRLCELLLMEDASYPWFLLVPRLEGAREVFELAWEDQVELLRESSGLSRALTAAFAPDKLNIASLGNLVPQLHLHHVVRYRGDPAWPGPVWGRSPLRPYASDIRRSVLMRLASAWPAELELTSW
jgi:diadenosine tetraphosphate (Ap4A) HIT family hydrolase